MSEAKGNLQAERLRRMWKIFLLVVILATIVLVAFVSLVIYATSVKVETWRMTREYDEGFWLHNHWNQPKFSATIKFAVGNPSAFTVAVRNLTIKLTINGIDMGSTRTQGELPVIPAFDWLEFTTTFSVLGDDADTLESALAYDVYVSLRGEASCMFYKTLFETTYQKSYS